MLEESTIEFLKENKELLKKIDNILKSKYSSDNINLAQLTTAVLGAFIIDEITVISDPTGGIWRSVN